MKGRITLPLSLPKVELIMSTLKLMCKMGKFRTKAKLDPLKEFVIRCAPKKRFY